MSNPRVTALIDTYNHERFIEQAIVSALEQDFPASEMEILVVDDGSTDRTPEIVRKFEARLRLIRKGNGGQASAFNAGVAHAQGEIVAFLDGDDWWARHKVAEVVDTFDANPGLGAVGHGLVEVVMGEPNHTLVLPERSCRLTMKDVAAVRSFHATCALLGGSRLSVRKSVLDRILPIPEKLVFAADAFIYILAVAMAGAVVLDQPLCFYRVHGGNLSETKDLAKFRRRIEMMDCYAADVLPPLSKLGLPPEVMSAFFDPLRLESERFYLAHHGGSPWRTFQIERTSYHWSYRDAGLTYKLFKALVLGLALVLPPGRFYRLKNWYASKGLRRLREKLGDAIPAEPIRLLRRPVT